MHCRQSIKSEISVSDIECIADHVLLIKKGQIVATGTPVELIEKMQGKVADRKSVV